jgi:adenylate cyclase
VRPPIREPPGPDLLPRLRACGDLAQLFDGTLDALERHCGIGYSMLLMHDPAHERLYTVASRGYRESGVGWEVHVGDGIIGVSGRGRFRLEVARPLHLAEVPTG